MKRSILLDSGADLISYGMGERSIIEIAEALDAGLDIKDITYIDGTVCKVKNLDSVYDAEILPPYEEMKSKISFCTPKAFTDSICNTDPFSGKRLVEPYSDHLYVVQNPPAKPLTQQEMDDVYALPYMRTYHPSYENGRRSSGNPGDQIQSDQQQGMFWRLQFLCTDIPSGKDHSDTKSGITDH